MDSIEREASGAARRTHPNIINVYGCRQGQDGWVFVVMDHLEGRDLDRLLLDEGVPGLPWERVLELLRQVAAGLDYAHAEGVIHRDLKPGNVYITERGEVKPLDFGLGYRLRSSRSAVGVHETGASGTPQYIPPGGLRRRHLPPGPGHLRPGLPGLRDAVRRSVTNVSWKDAVGYAAWVSEQTSHEYRLPTQSEREYAVRAGTTTPFQFGATITADQANDHLDGTRGGGPERVDRGKTLEIGPSAPNTWGLQGTAVTSGNGRAGGAKGTTRVMRPGALATIGADGASLVVRSGSWSHVPQRLRAAFRARTQPSDRTVTTGFRLARPLIL